jgi:hypothetical protein
MNYGEVLAEELAVPQVCATWCCEFWMTQVVVWVSCEVDPSNVERQIKIYDTWTMAE